MILSLEQRCIFKNMLLALSLVIGIVIAVWQFPLNWQISRVEICLLALILPTCSYVIGIGRIAVLRFIDESVSNPLLASNNLKLNSFKQYLSNTHEQLFLAIIVYFLLSASLPLERVYLVIILSLCFSGGRILFARGYRCGAAGRSLGFALTFYSNVVGFLLGVVVLIKNVL